MTLEIIKAGAPILKQTAAPVERVDAKTRTLLDQMAETMKAADGVGLAAPQVGVSIRAVVIDVGEGLLEMVNPEITAREGEAIDSEGCLSVPGIFGDVVRAESVRVTYTDRRNKRKSLKAKGLLARCIQHEVDHLNGILFIDIATTLRQEEKEAKGA